MKRPDKKQVEAIRKFYQLNPLYFETFVQYLIDARDHEREQMEQCKADQNELQKGRCQLLTELSNNLQSLVAKVTSS